MEEVRRKVFRAFSASQITSDLLSCCILDLSIRIGGEDRTNPSPITLDKAEIPLDWKETIPSVSAYSIMSTSGEWTCAWRSKKKLFFDTESVKDVGITEHSDFFRRER